MQSSTYSAVCSLLLFSSLLFSSAIASASTYYVDGTLTADCTTGNYSVVQRRCTGGDGNAWNTINKGVRGLQAGDTLLIRGGVYAERLIDRPPTRIPSGNDWSSPVTIAGYPGERAIMRPAGLGDVIRVMGPAGGTHHVIFKNLVLDGAQIPRPGPHCGIKMTHEGSDPEDVANEAHHIRVQDSEIMNAPNQGILGCGKGSEIINNKSHHNGLTNQSHGIYCSSRDVLIDGNEFYENAGFGIHAYKEGGTVGPNVIVRNNRSHHNGRALDGGPGIIMGGNGNFVYNNIVWSNNVGIMIRSSQARNINVYNNTSYGNGTGIVVENAPNVKLINNIVFGNTLAAIGNRGSNPGLVEMSNQLDDPMFVDAANADFRPRAGSPAIDTGVDLSAEGVITDIEGGRRPAASAFDRGAYEFGSTRPVPPPPPPSPADEPPPDPDADSRGGCSAAGTGGPLALFPGLLLGRVCRRRRS